MECSTTTLFILTGISLPFILMTVAMWIVDEFVVMPKCFRTNPDPIAKGYLECVECSVREECEK